MSREGHLLVQICGSSDISLLTGHCFPIKILTAIFILKASEPDYLSIFELLQKNDSVICNKWFRRDTKYYRGHHL